MAKATLIEVPQVERIEDAPGVKEASQKLGRVKGEIAQVEQRLRELEAGDVGAARAILDGEEPMDRAEEMRRLRDRLQTLREAESLAESQLDEAICQAFRERYARHKQQHLALVDAVCDALTRLVEAVRREEQFRAALSTCTSRVRLEPPGIDWRLAPVLRQILLLLDPGQFRNHQERVHGRKGTNR